MINMPAVRTMVGLIRTYVINKANFLGLARYFPPDFTTQKQSSTLAWWVEGVLVGLMSPYQLGTDARRLQARKRTYKTMGTAFWRGARSIEEADLLTVLNHADPEQKTLAGRQLVLDAVADIGDQILETMEYTGWLALDNGLTAYSVEGTEMQIDYGLAAPTQVAAPWATVATAVPHQDIQAELAYFAGTGVTEVDVVMNQHTSNLAAKAEAIEDRITGSAFAFLTGNGAILTALKQLVQSADSAATPGAPRLRDVLVYDEGYWSDASTYSRFIPNGRVFLIGSRPAVAGERGPAADAGTVGRWISTPALHQSYDDIKPGPFITYEDRTNISPKEIACEGGINGLPAIQRPTWVRRLKISAP